MKRKSEDLLSEESLLKSRKVDVVTSPLTFEDLPGKIQSRIFAYLNTSDLKNVSLVSKRCKQLAQPFMNFELALDFSKEPTFSKEVLVETLKKLSKDYTLCNHMDFTGCENIDADVIEYIRQYFLRISALTLINCEKIDDESLKQLSALKSLNELRLGKNLNIEKTTIDFFTELASGIVPPQWKSKITDTGLAYLSHSVDLNLLTLDGCEYITDEGLAHLAKIPTLRYLNLSSCKRITGTGLVYLTRSPALLGLVLHSCYNLTDVGLAQLAGLTTLKCLLIFGCAAVTDEVVAHITQLPNLISLRLVESDALTSRGVHMLKILQAQHPAMEIEYR